MMFAGFVLVGIALLVTLNARARAAGRSAPGDTARTSSSDDAATAFSAPSIDAMVVGHASPSSDPWPSVHHHTHDPGCASSSFHHDGGVGHCDSSFGDHGGGCHGGDSGHGGHDM